MRERDFFVGRVLARAFCDVTTCGDDLVAAGLGTAKTTNEIVDGYEHGWRLLASLRNTPSKTLGTRIVTQAVCVDSSTPTTTVWARSAMHVAVIQLNSQEDVSHNLSRVKHWVARAAASGAELVTLPENFAFMGEEARRRELAERLDGSFAGPILSALVESAAAHEILAARRRNARGE